MSVIPVDRWPQISALFDEVLALPEVQRTDFIERLRANQPDLAPGVQALLAAHARAETGDFLDRGPSVALSDHDADALQPGEAIGPYRLLRPLGRGGMAVVWLAERSDGAMAREVALKLPQRFSWRPGLAERFARERDILARLEHPHIARLYDAGVSAADGPGNGLPYLAMEFVQGTGLTAYCDEHQLDIARRLALAMQVLDAVQFAHTQLVVHRDLKPANILVTEDGQVRLLDFGVAKLLQAEDGPAQTQLTQVAGAAFTPDYASPEQVRGEPLGTPSDVYSLGVVLYELLCGQRPYELRHGSLAQLEHAIVEADPQPPSARVDAAAADRRGTPLRRLQRQLRGELDTIVLKALKKQPAQRYATVAALAEDLRRWRDGEPVLARPDSWAYRAGKLLRRHKAAAAGALATVLAVSVGLGAALWQGRVAQQQRDRALRMVERSNSVNDFMADLLRDAARGERGAVVGELLERAIALVDAGYGQDRGLQADLLMMVAIFKGSLQGPAAAMPLFDRVQSMLGPDADWNQVVRLRCSRQQGDLLTGRTTPDQARRSIADVAGNANTTPDEGANCLYALAALEGMLGNHGAAVAAARQSLALLDRSTLANPKQHLMISGLLAGELTFAGQVREGQALFEAIDANWTRLRAERSLSGYVLRGNWATASFLTGMPRRALELSQRNLAWLHEDRPDEPPTPTFVYTGAAAAADLGRYQQALEGCHDLLAVAQKVHDDRLVLAAHVLAATSQAQLGHLEEAEREYALAAAIRSPMLAPGHFGQLGLTQARAAIDLKQGRSADVLKNTALLLADPMTNKPQKQQARITRSTAELAAGDAAAALDDAQAAVALGRELQGDQPASSRTGRALLAEAKARQALGQADAARGSLAEAERQLAATVDDDHPALAEARRLQRP